MSYETAHVERQDRMVACDKCSHFTRTWYKPPEAIRGNLFRICPACYRHWHAEQIAATKEGPR